MRSTIHGVAIRGIACALPRKRVDIVEDLQAQFGADEVRRVSSTTSIRAFREAAEDQTASDLMAAAAEQLKKALDLDFSTVDGIVCVTQTPDYLLPATGALLQHRLGVPQTAITFDVNSGCAGFVHGLLLAASLIGASGLKRVLLVTGDLTTRIIHPNDRGLRLLFGDAAAATLVEKAPENEKMSFAMGTDGSGANALIVPGRMFRKPTPDNSTIPPEYLRMDGMGVMNFGLREVPPLITAILEQHGWQKDDVDEFVLHQANAMMIEFIRRKLKVPTEKVPVVMQETGNTGPSSIPVAIGVLGKGKARTILSGFGVGLMWGAVACDLSQTVVAPTVDA